MQKNYFIEELRKSRTDLRRERALELAKTNSPERITELIRMVEARRKRLLWYNLSDQKIGVEALGETGDDFARAYLQRVYGHVEKHTIHRQGEMIMA